MNPCVKRLRLLYETIVSFTFGMLALTLIASCAPQGEKTTPSQAKPGRGIESKPSQKPPKSSQDEPKPKPPQDKAEPKPPEDTPTPSQDSTEATALKRFKKFVAKVQFTLPKTHYFAKQDVEVAYDVRKSDSLVSPLAAILHIKWRNKAATSYDCTYALECAYGFQEGRWVYQSAKVYIVDLENVPAASLGMKKIMLDVYKMAFTDETKTKDPTIPILLKNPDKL